MEVLYKSTRGKEDAVTASMAILKGLSEDGGLFVPTSVPKLDIPVEKLAQMNYQETAYEVMSRFLTDFTEEELKSCIRNAYDEKFDTKEIAPLREADGAYYLELFHGKTIAFKDMALSILPHLMTTAARKNQVKNDIVILTATSGDTGKAALAGFADVPGTKIVVFYPKHGVSMIQEKQMVTQKGDNTCVIGITGNFDDAQTAVKKMFNDKELAAQLNEAGFQFSSANSINIGRLVPQIVYYVYAYASLIRQEKIKDGEEFVVRLKSPGNFNNKIILHDEVRGDIEFPENDLDIVLIKSTDKLPTYHFAHLVDDHLMRTTHITRGEEWIASFPIHDQLFSIFNFKKPKYAHLGLVMKIDENGVRRKLSKRKDKDFFFFVSYLLFIIKKANLK